jgi:hypothetical protein
MATGDWEPIKAETESDWEPIKADAPAPATTMLPSHAAPPRGINMGTLREYVQAPTPEATTTGEFLTQTVPRSITKGLYGIGQAGERIVKAAATPVSGPVEVAKQVGREGIGVLKGMSTAMGLRPPEPGAATDPQRDYGVGLPSSLEQWGAREKHQIRTDPFGVVGSVAGIKGAAKAAPEIVKPLAVPVLESAAKAGGKLATKLTDMTLKQKTSLKPEVRAQNIEQAHKGGFLPTAKGVDNLNSAIIAKEAELANGIAAGDAAQVKGTFDRSIANLEALREKANRSSDPIKNNALIDSEIAKLKEHPLLDANGQVDIGTLQKMKVEQGQAIEPKYGQVAPDAFQIRADKARIRGMKEELESKLDNAFPELSATNKQLGQYYELKKVLTKAANRIQNNQGIGIGLPIKSGAGAAIGGALAGPIGAGIGGTIGTLIGIVEHPSIAPRLARQLYKASKGAMSYAEALKTTKARIADIGFEDFKSAKPEVYDPSLRTPDEVAPAIEHGRAEVTPLGYGEREIRPGFTGEAPPAEAPANVQQNLGPGFPKAAPIAPQPGRGATLIDNKLMQSPQGAVYQEGYGTPNPKFDNTPPPVKATPINPQSVMSGYDLMDTEIGGGPGTKFVKDGETYTVDEVLGGPEPMAIAYAEGSKTPIRVKGSDTVQKAGDVAPTKKSGSGIEKITGSDGQDVKVFRNPSKSQAETLLSKSKDKNIRYSIDKNTGDVYMWDSYDAIHSEVNKQLGIETEGHDKTITQSEEVDYVLKMAKEGGPESSESFLARMKTQGYEEGGMVTSPQANAPNTTQDSTLPEGAGSALLPSVKFRGKTYDGSITDHHADILESNKIGRKQPHEKGFMTPDGKFLTRQQSAAYMQKEGYTDVPDSLHSEDLRAILRKGKPEPQKVKPNRRKAKKEMMNES